MKDILPNIIRTEIVDNMPLELIVSNIDDMVLSVCTTSYIREGTVIKDDNDIEYTVTAFEPFTSVTVDASGFVGNIHLRKPLFLDGRPKTVNQEYKDISSISEDKLPLIWLLSGSDENLQSRNSSIGNEFTCRLFFMDTYNQKWINEELNTNSMQPVANLTELFKSTIESNSTVFQSLNTFNRTDEPRFTGEGADKRVIDDFLTGYTVRVSATIYGDCGCLGYAEQPVLPITCADGTANALNSDGDVIKTWSVPSGGVGEGYINDTAVRARNSNDDVVASGVSLGGALGYDLALPDTNYEIQVDGVVKDSFSLPTLEDSTITITLT